MVNIHPYRNRYYLLMKDLHHKKFRWFVPNDDNRAFEGRNLREQFSEEMDVDYDTFLFEEEVSMLELILALAIRCDSIMADSIENVSISEWFWRLLSNVGLEKFTDDDYYTFGGPKKVDEILEKIIERRYTRSGKGGLFPLKYPKKDQRKVEIWYQMCHFLVENFYVEDLVV